MTTEAAERIWAKILQARGIQETYPTGRAGSIPVFDDGGWRIFRNSLTIYPGAENCIDPVKVDILRANVNSLLDHYPETIPKLEKLGARVRALLNRQIETYEDVITWADSMFNSGPIQKLQEPRHIHDTRHLAYDDFIIEVKKGVYVIPAGPRGSGVKETLDFSVPGSKKRYGARHEYTRAALTKQLPKTKPPRYRGKTAEGEPQRPRGRPRKDGLVPGSPDARRADKKKAREAESRRAARLKAKQEERPKASITELRPRPRPRLKRVGQRKEATN